MLWEVQRAAFLQGLEGASFLLEKAPGTSQLASPFMYPLAMDPLGNPDVLRQTFSNSECIQTPQRARQNTAAWDPLPECLTQQVHRGEEGWIPEFLCLRSSQECQGPTAAGRNYHKSSGLNQFITLTILKFRILSPTGSRWAKMKVSALLSGDSRKESAFLLLPASKSRLNSFACDPSFHLQERQQQPPGECLSHLIAPTLTALRAPPCLKTFVITLDPPG